MSAITYTAVHDQNADDPRTDNALDLTEPVLFIYAGDFTDDLEDLPREEQYLVANAFETTRQNHDENTAAKVAERYARVILGHSRATVTLHNLHGYSQSDWWSVMVYVPNITQAPNPDAYAYTLQAWLRGDVWRVDALRETTCCECHATTSQLIESCGGIYADTEEEAIAYFKENYAPEVK